MPYFFATVDILLLLSQEEPAPAPVIWIVDSWNECGVGVFSIAGVADNEDIIVVVMNERRPYQDIWTGHKE